MVKLNLEDLKHRSEWSAAGIDIPSFDIDKMREHTKTHPRWVHIGPGNIFRGFIADLADRLLEAGEMESGITVVSTFDQQLISQIYEPYDDMALRVVMTADGRFFKKSSPASVKCCAPTAIIPRNGRAPKRYSPTRGSRW